MVLELSEALRVEVRAFPLLAIAEDRWGGGLSRVRARSHRKEADGDSEQSAETNESAYEFLVHSPTLSLLTHSNPFTPATD